MHVIPVIDLLGRQVVRGVGGRRDEYRPIVSSLVASSEPGAVAAALQQSFRLPRVYVADLDAIMHSQRDVKSWQAIAAAGWQLTIDAGLQTADDAAELRDFLARDFPGAEYVIGLESWKKLSDLEKLSRHGEPVLPSAVFSLDLKEGRPLTRDPAWHEASAVEIGRKVARCGIRRLIVLDLADIGGGGGTSTLPLIRQLRQEWPDLEIVAGGGIRGPADLRELAAAGVSAALVASALHDGRITASDINAL